METMVDIKVEGILSQACEFKFASQADLPSVYKGISFEKVFFAIIWAKYKKDEYFKTAISESSKSVLQSYVSVNPFNEICVRCSSESFKKSVAENFSTYDEVFDKMFYNFGRNIKFFEKVNAEIPDLLSEFDRDVLVEKVSNEERLHLFEYAIKCFFFFLKNYKMTNYQAFCAAKRHLSSFFGKTTMGLLMEQKNEYLFFIYEYVFTHNIKEMWSKEAKKCIKRNTFAFLKAQLKP